MSKLYIVATPIGNLEDISLRAIRILGEVDLILCEDTRVTKNLLNHYNIKTPTASFHQHSDEVKISHIINDIKNGKDIALVTDAGTPGISDPGGKLVAAVLEEFGDEVSVESIPGPSAVTAALSISGIPTDKFVFMGFPPHKKGRQTFIRQIIESHLPVVVYESKHRIIKFLQEMKGMTEALRMDAMNMMAALGDAYADKDKVAEYRELIKKTYLTSVVVCRELSKMHETVYRGDIDTIIERITSDQNDQKGEFVVIIGK